MHLQFTYEDVVYHYVPITASALSHELVGVLRLASHHRLQLAMLKHRLHLARLKHTIQLQTEAQAQIAAADLLPRFAPAESRLDKESYYQHLIFFT